MTQAEKVIQIARSELGSCEANGGDDKYLKWYGGLPMTAAWCAVFASWVYFQHNKNLYFPKFASCDNGLKWFIDTGRFKANPRYGGNGKYKPKMGDLIFFSEPKTLADSTHVGIVIKSDSKIVYTIEGNTSDMVKEKKYEIDKSTILGYGTIPFSDESKAPATDDFNYSDWLKKLQKQLNLPQTGRPSVELLAKTPTIKLNSKGAIVGLLQEFLVAQGYNLGNSGPNRDGVDNHFGPKTESAVKLYQKEAVKLSKPDAVLDGGKNTWKKILNM
jgi:hypothetical protein